MKDVFRGIAGANKHQDNFFKFFAINLLSGALAGAIGLVVSHPLNYARVRMAVDVGTTPETREFRNLRHVFSRTLESDGPKGFYRGITPTILGLVVYRGLHFGLYDTFSNVGIANSSFIAKFLLGYTATLLAGICSYPFSTVSTRLMMQSCREDKLYTNTVNCFSRIIQNEGVKGLFKGQLVSITSGVFGATMLVVYDAVKMNLG